MRRGKRDQSNTQKSNLKYPQLERLISIGSSKPLRNFIEMKIPNGTGTASAHPPKRPIGLNGLDGTTDSRERNG